ncbi:MAG TPA: HEAT repeat domain-containing protein [Gemmatimonadales bacterium]|nr:HEAT repeat domain-containing protein [Gemmatimonadales bacterium]
MIPITAPRSLLLLLLSAVLWSVGCRHDERAGAKEPRGARNAPVESEAARLKEIDRIGPTAVKDRAARANLGRALRDSRSAVRRQAAYWLSKSGYEAIPILVTSLSDTNTYARVEAAYALGLMGEAAASAAPALSRQLGGNIDTVANMANWALSQIGPRGKGGLIPLIRNLRYGNAFDRAEAARKLSLYGEASADAIPLLARSLEDPDPLVAQAAAQALVRIGPRASLAVEAMLTSPKPQARLRAVLVLSRMRSAYF